MNRRAFLLTIPAAFAAITLQARIVDRHEGGDSDPVVIDSIACWEIILTGTDDPVVNDPDLDVDIDPDEAWRLSESIGRLCDILADTT